MALDQPAGTNEPHEDAAAQLIGTLAGRRDEFIGFLSRRTSGPYAEDLLQQALLLAARKVNLLREPDLLLPWFYQILRRTLADHHTRSTIQADRRRMLETEVQAVGETNPTCGCSLTTCQRAGK